MAANTVQAVTEEGKLFGQYLRDLRRKKGLNQQELADSLEISGGYYGFFEQGRQMPSKKIVRRLARVLGADYRDLLERAGHEFGKEDEAWLASGEDESAATIGQEAGRNSDVYEVRRRPQPSRTEGASGGAAESVTIAETSLDQERLDWAMLCITNDPSYRLSEQFLQGTQPDATKALLIQLYQAQTRRHLLTPEETEALSQLIHG
jgi:transcriptional regulator with XRE-family HTH domain